MEINIGLLGLGTVASGVYSILSENYNLILDRLREETGKEYKIKIKKILVRDMDKYGDYPKALLTNRPEDILEDETIDIVCELIGGDDLALDFMLRAMDRGKHVVTANKKAIFSSGERLFDKAKSKEVQFRYEGAVAGGLPIIDTIKSHLFTDRIYELEGILNGSTNFILTHVSQGLSYEESFKLAEEKGYLEADPSLDIGGYDALYKLGILGKLLAGSFPKEAEISRLGIDKIDEKFIEKSRETGEKIKLIARMSKFDGKFKYSVGPELVQPTSPFYQVDGSSNGLIFKCENVGEIFISGPGAGSRETATAVWADIIHILRSEYNG